MFDRIQKKFSEFLGISKDSILPESRISEDLKVQSIEIAELIIMLEDEIGVEMEDDALLKIKTINDIVVYLEKKLAK